MALTYEPPTLTSLQQLRAGRLTFRVSQLMVGLFLYGFTMAMLVESTLGLDPWDVFHQGLANHVPLTFGQVVIAVGAAVLVLWIPLKQWPGLGTVLNVIVIGLAADFGLAVISRPDDLWLRGALLIGGIVGVGTVLYALSIGPIVQFFLPRVQAKL